MRREPNFAHTALVTALLWLCVTLLILLALKA